MCGRTSHNPPGWARRAAEAPASLWKGNSALASSAGSYFPGVDPAQKWPHPLCPHWGSHDPRRTVPRVRWPNAAALVSVGLSAVAEIGQECGESPRLSKRPDPPGRLLSKGAVFSFQDAGL